MDYGDWQYALVLLVQRVIKASLYTATVWCACALYNKSYDMFVWTHWSQAVMFLITFWFISDIHLDDV